MPRSLTEKQLELAKRFGFGRVQRDKSTKLEKRMGFPKKQPARKGDKRKNVRASQLELDLRQSQAKKPKVEATNDWWENQPPSYNTKAPLELQDPGFLIARIFDIANDREKKEVLIAIRAARKEHMNGAEVLKEEYLGSVPQFAASLAGYKRFILAK